MREELKNLQRKLGLTTIFVTHDQEEAMTTADRMAVLDKGVLQQVGTASALFDFPTNRLWPASWARPTWWRARSAGHRRNTTFQADGMGVMVLPRTSETPGTGPPPWRFGHTVNIRVRDEHVGRISLLAGWPGGKLGVPGRAVTLPRACGEAVIGPTSRTTRGFRCSSPGPTMRQALKIQPVRFHALMLAPTDGNHRGNLPATRLCHRGQDRPGLT